MQKFHILMIDDEDTQREAIAGFLRKKKYDVHTSSSCDEGIEYFRNNQVDLIITDYKMPEKTGEDVIKEAREINPAITIVVVTAHGKVDIAVDLLKKGAYDYIQKPIELMELIQIIEKVKERQYLISENEILRQQLKEKYSFDSIISESSEMEEVLNTTARVADSKASILIRGESGTGKELIAKAIHYASSRKDKPFVVVNCAAMPETLFESELFGHEKGAFTGANKQRIGKFEQADGGTLFIDEVGDIPAQIQVKLLRAIQFGQIERLGGDSTIDLDVRIVSATNRNLEEMIEKGEFREDLYYRFNVVTIRIPPLRKRKLDIKPLVSHFIKRYSNLNHIDKCEISKEALDALLKYNYPGNIRELENIIQRAVVLSRDGIITVKDLPDLNLKSQTNNKNDIKPVMGNLNQKVEEMEKMLIKEALEISGGNQVKAAEMLEINERTLRYKMSKYNLKK
jgi:DNA-binding NtrC family response regulator